jgi:hypothetical protein
MEDVIEKDPMAAYPPDQENVIFQTGDRVIDAWERAIAKGDTPDIKAAFENDPAIQAWLSPKKKDAAKDPQQVQSPVLDPDELEFRDDFTGGFDGKP